MSNIPTVYHGGREGSVSALYTPVDSLLNHLKNVSPLKGDIYYNCPSFISWAKNKLVMKAPADISIAGNVDEYVQFLNGEYFFFADDQVKMTVYPPFLDFNNIKGVVGEMDISKWFRAIQPTSVMDEKGNLAIRQGEALLYVGFDIDVKLQRVIFPNSLQSEDAALQSFKSVGIKGRTLSKLYDSFLRARADRVILKKIKDYNNL